MFDSCTICHLQTCFLCVPFNINDAIISHVHLHILYAAVSTIGGANVVTIKVLIGTL